MNYLNPHKLVISGGVAKLQTTNPAEQLQNQALATEAFDLLNGATSGTSQAQDLTSAEDAFTYEDLMVMWVMDNRPTSTTYVVSRGFLIWSLKFLAFSPCSHWSMRPAALWCIGCLHQSSFGTFLLSSPFH